MSTCDSFSRYLLRFTLRSFAAFAALGFTSPGLPVFAQDAAPPASPVLTVIVTRHGVRSYANPDDKPPVNADEELDQSKYAWADWGPGISPNDLTLHGYRLMKIMGEFYKQAQIKEKLPVDCSANNMFVYADMDQRTLGTAHALIEGMCDEPNLVKVFHEVPDKKCLENAKVCPKDPIFNATDWLHQKSLIDLSLSIKAVTAAAGLNPPPDPPPDRPVVDFTAAFTSFQGLLDKRCKQGVGLCTPLIKLGKTTIDPKGPLAALENKGSVAQARTYSEDVFLEYAQCGDITNPVTADQAPSKPTKPSSEDKAALQDGMRLHVLAYQISARNRYYNKDENLVYDPYIRGETLLWHIVAILDQKVGQTAVSGDPGTPSELKDKAIVIFSGHDTELGALGGILNAQWDTRNGNIEPDDMPPGSALVFDLMPPGSDKSYSVRLRFASMARKRFRTERPLNVENWRNDGISFYPVKYGICEPKNGEPPNGTTECNCDTEGCSAPLKDFETAALKGAEKGGHKIVADDQWKASSEPLIWDPGSSHGVHDPAWTRCESP
jgi:hypothetical protein